MRASRFFLAGWLALGTSACIPDVVPTEGSDKGPGCEGMAKTCGATGDEDCCTHRHVWGSAFQRKDGSGNTSNAAVADFMLDRFEVTVGRFRRFAGVYDTARPAEGDGAHPRVAGSGWKSSWDVYLPQSRAELGEALKCNPSLATWTDDPGPSEDQPINCVSWYLAFAFCAWDGGRLPTDAEWYFAATRGEQGAKYPWGDTPAPDQQHGSFDCAADGSAPNACAPSDILGVGVAAQGDGRWGHADLFGNMREWALDYFAAYPASCDDCAQTSKPADDQGRSTWGGDFAHPAVADMASSRIGFMVDNGAKPETFHGFRCARKP
jgi:formylglycine-generating enzyme required for sulfatase activity